MREISRSAQATRDLKVRKHVMEGSFADAANNHGFKRSRWRGLEKVTIQDFFIAAVQNIRILIKRWRKPVGVAQQNRAMGGETAGILSALTRSAHVFAMWLSPKPSLVNLCLVHAEHLTN